MAKQIISISVVLLCLLGIKPLVAQDGWVAQNSGTTQSLNGLSFPDPNSGWAVGNNGTILHTGNSGALWSAQTSGISEPLLAVSFHDDQTGTAVGHSGAILTTSNGGSRWNVVQNGWLISFYGTQMLSPTHGVAVGVNSIFQPLVFVTHDGWASWQGYSFYIVDGLSAHEGGLTDVHFVSPDIGFASAYVWTGEGAICRTLDGGANWDTLRWTAARLNGIHFPSQHVGYAVGDWGEIVKTEDGGDTWVALSTGVTAHFKDVWFESEARGMVVGLGGTILKTTDGGATWRRQDSGVAQPLYAAQGPALNTGYTAGDQGTLLYTSDGGGDPLLADTYELSAGGGQVHLSLDAGTGNSSRVYLVLGTLSGTTPGIPLPGGLATLPVNWDLFTDTVLARLNTPPFLDFFASLDLNGRGVARIDSGPVNPGKIGKTMHYAFVLEGPPWDFASNPVAITFVP